MNDFRISSLQNSSIINLFHQRDKMLMNPEYQREGGIWPLSKKRLLIDSLLNGFDIPKFYLHEFYPAQKIKDKIYRYAIIDGRQRLETIWAFINNEFTLDPDFKLIDNPKEKIGELGYDELGVKYPIVRDYFNGIVLDVISIVTDDIELIEEMFYRLNEAAPLNAAEKRNAFSGPVALLIRNVSAGKFFKANIPYSNRRYRHYDLACKFLFFCAKNRITDTKRVHLDEFAEKFRDKALLKVHDKEVALILKKMSAIFTHNDALLKSPSMAVLYFLLFKNANAADLKKLNRKAFLEFDSARAKNRVAAEENEGQADSNLLEFDRLTQTPNDSYAIEYRLSIIRKHILGD